MSPRVAFDRAIAVGSRRSSCPTSSRKIGTSWSAMEWGFFSRVGRDSIWVCDLKHGEDFILHRWTPGTMIISFATPVPSRAGIVLPPPALRGRVGGEWHSAALSHDPMCCSLSASSRLQIGDTADCKSALRWPGSGAGVASIESGSVGPGQAIQSVQHLSSASRLCLDLCFCFFRSFG